jgi:uncharacterized Fe-S cluster-containing protein
MTTTKSEEKSSEFKKYVKDLLQCPVCIESIKTTPIHQCANGHVICKDCIPKLNNCPICRNDSTLSRNLMIEQIIEKFDEIQPENKGLIKKPELQIWGNISTVAYSSNNDSDVSMMSVNDDNESIIELDNESIIELNLQPQLEHSNVDVEAYSEHSNIQGMYFKSFAPLVH